MSHRAIAILIALGFLGMFNTGYAAFDPPVQGTRIAPSEVRAALQRWNWRADAAQEYSVVPVYITDLSYLQAQGFTVNALLIEQCPWQNSSIYISPEIATRFRDSYIWHEFQHLTEYANTCKYETDTMIRDMRLLERDHPELVESYRNLIASGRKDAMSHFNHSLAASVNYDYSKIPAAYRSIYFWYALSTHALAYPAPTTATPIPVGYPPPNPIRTPTTVPYPPPVSIPYPPPVNRLALPLVRR